MTKSENSVERRRKLLKSRTTASIRLTTDLLVDGPGLLFAQSVIEATLPSVLNKWAPRIDQQNVRRLERTMAAAFDIARYGRWGIYAMVALSAPVALVGLGVGGLCLWAIIKALREQA